MRADLQDLIRSILWVLVAAAILPTRADPDLWGNVRFGADILDAWSVSTVDPYSFTSDKPWINHSWLPQVLMAAVYSSAGVAGLVALKAIGVGLVLRLVAGAFAGAAFLVPEAAVVAVLVPGTALFTTARAQLWSLVCLVVLCRLMLSRRPSAMAWAPVLLVVWVNAHVGWIIGLAVLCWWGVGCLARGGARDEYRAIAILAASLAATLVNPYGWRMWSFVFDVAHLSRDISEWQPLSAAPLLNRVSFGVCAVAVLLTASRIPVERLVSIAGLGYATLRAIKFNTMFIATSVLFMAPAIVARFPRRSIDTPHIPTGIRFVNGTVVALLLAYTIVTAWPSITCLRSGDWRPDAVAARALITGRPAGRIVVPFDWGEYVIWHLGPELRVSYDPRYDLVYSATVIAEQDAVERMAPDGVSFLERSRPEYIWFRQSNPALKSWAAASGYRLDIDTPESFIAVRQDLAALTDPGLTSSGAFPAP